MSNKNIVLKTERLYIIPMTEEELRLQIEAEQDPETKKAYEEMLAGYLNEPIDYLWYLPWKIVLQDSKKAIGDICFKGPQIRGTVEIGYGLLPSFRRQGYMKEAVEAVVKWAFKQPGVYTVAAETAPENKDSRMLLEHSGFVMFANGQEGPRYRRIKPVVHYGFLVFALALLVGMILGIVIKDFNSGLCFGIGAGAGVIAGFFTDYRESAIRKRTTGNQ